MAARMFARNVSRVARPMLFSHQRFRLVSNVTNTPKPLIENETTRSAIQRAKMSTTVTPNDFLTDRNSAIEWLPKVFWQIWDYLPVRGVVEYFAKKRMSREAVDALERLTKGKDYKVRRGKKGITIQVYASGFGHEDLKFAMVKKHLVIKGETTNLHRKSIKHKTSVPVSDWKKYDMRGLVAESKNGLVKVFIPFSKK